MRTSFSVRLGRDGGSSPARSGGPALPAGIAWLAVPAAYLVGSIPFSNIAARRLGGVDLRSIGTGTVSGTGLYATTGLRVLVAVGLLEVAKGAVGPLLAGRDDPRRAALAAAAAVSGHNWSPWLGGAGGRGISPALGALLVTAPAGTATLLAGLAGGRVAGETALGCLVADGALVPVCGAVHGRAGRQAALAVVVPLLAKRLAGNAPVGGDRRTYLWRLLLDRDTPAPARKRRAGRAGAGAIALAGGAPGTASRGRRRRRTGGWHLAGSRRGAS